MVVRQIILCCNCNKPVTVSGHYDEICVDGSTWFETYFFPQEGDSYILSRKPDCVGARRVFCCNECLHIAELEEKRAYWPTMISRLRAAIDDEIKELERLKIEAANDPDLERRYVSKDDG